MTESYLQFFLRVPDSHVGQYLKMFTLLPVAEVENVLGQHQVHDLLVVWLVVRKPYISISKIPNLAPRSVSSQPR